jgi:serine/threonine protein kinase/WD40 repeat protein/Flp pilus assembly protein TadD
MMSGSSDERNPVEVLAEEFLARQRRGERPSLDEYTARYPELAEAIHELFPVLLDMEDARLDAAAAAGPVVGPGRPFPERLGDYRLLRELGRGGMGIVYEAEQESLGRRVALKVLARAALTPQQVRRFEREARSAGKLHHTNIVPVFGVGREGSTHYYVMQYIPGQPLDEVLKEVRRQRQRGPERAGGAADTAVGRREDRPSTDEVARSLWSGTGLVRAGTHGLEDSATPAGSLDPGDPGMAAAATLVAPALPIDAITPAEPAMMASAPPEPPNVDVLPPSANLSGSGRRYARAVARIGVQVAEALEYAAEQGVIHRDVKPSNILLDPCGTAWVTDFGLAKMAGQEDLTHTGDLLGTLRYMAPERFGGQADRRSDVYALGLTLYELLALRPAYDESDRGRLISQVTEEEPPRLTKLEPTIPRDLATVVHKAMAREPAQRYATAGALAADLKRFLEDRPIEARRPSLLDRAAKWSRRYRAAVITAAVAGVVLLAAVSVVATVAAFWLRDERNATRSQLAETRKARREGQHRLYQAKLAQAQASRWSGRAGRRFEGLKALDEAARLAQELHLGPGALLTLRNEAIACMILPDLHLDQQWEGTPPQSGVPIGMAFDASLERYARVEADGTVTVRSLADNAILVHITDLGAPTQRVVDWRVRLRFSKDGRFLATRSDPYYAVRLQVWDLSGPRRILTVPACGFKTRQDFDFSPDSRTLATAQADGSIGLYDLRSARLLKSLAPGSFPTGLSFHPAGQKLAVSRDRDSAVRLLDLDGRPSGQPLTHPEPVATTPVWHPEGELLASGCHNGSIYVWHAPTGKPVAVCKGRRDDVIRVAFSQGGDLLASAGWDGMTRLWDPRTGRQLVVAQGQAVDFSRDDRWLGWELDGPYVGRWEVATGHECRLLRGAGAQAAVRSVDIDREGRVLAAAADDGVHLWDMSAGKEVQVLGLGLTCSVIFDPSGRFLLTSGPAGLYRWPMRWNPDPSAARLQLGPAQILDLPYGCQPDECTQSRDGQRLALHTQSSGEAIFLDLAKPRRRLRSVRVNALWNAVISPDGRWIATGTWNGYACKVWDAQTGRCLQDLPARIARPAFSPDNRWLVLGTFQEYAFHQLEGDRWECRRRLARDKGAARAGLAAFTRDARMVAVAYSARSIQLLDTAEWRERATISAPDSEVLSWLCFSPDGGQLAAGTVEGTIQLWDLRRIRARLREKGLDWNLPPIPPLARDQADATPWHCRVELGAPVAAAAVSPEAWSRVQRGNALRGQGKLEEAGAAYREAIRLKPDYALAHQCLGVALKAQGKLDDAITEYREAIRLKPDYALAHQCLGVALRTQGDVAGAIAEYREAIRLEPDDALAHNNLGLALKAQGKLDDAITEYREAIRLGPDDALAHRNLGNLQMERGQFADARNSLLRARELGATSPDQARLAEQSLRRVEQLIGLEGRLPAVLQGDDQPEDAAERLEFAMLCYYKGLFAASARFSEDAFTDRSELADDWKSGHRYNAACSAALAGSGRAKDDPPPDEAARARLRGQALAWLRADLVTWTGRTEDGTPSARDTFRQKLRHWQVDPDLAGLRDEAEVAKLPEVERAACHDLWTRVNLLLLDVDFPTDPFAQ